MNPENRWIRLADNIPWDEFEKKYADLLPSDTGNVAKSLRMALGSLIIQKKFQFSDRELVEQITENPYLQYFIGLPGYQDEPPFLLSNECNVSHWKIRKLLKELTGGRLEISDGMINHLSEEFALKSDPEKKEIISRLMSSPVMNADFTNANVNGRSAQVLVLASPVNGAGLYIGREKKGHEGIKGTPLEYYVGTVVHDHDRTFYRYGTRHQECTQHDCRYLVGSKENEPALEWNHRMHELFQEMLHYRNGLQEDEPDPVIVADFEIRYDEILDKAAEEYEANPPSTYYREGYNLSVRLREYKESELLFLHDKRVPANNSLCERLARVYKRKQKQAIVLRSQKSLEYICDGLSTVYLLRNKTRNVYQEIAAIFERKIPPKIKKIREVSVLT